MNLNQRYLQQVRETNEFNYDEFIHIANTWFVAHSENMRYGQYLMNSLQNYHPEIYNSLPESCDCFYDNLKVVDFLVYLSELSSQES